MGEYSRFGIIPVFRGLEGKLSVQKEISFPTEEDAKRAGEVFAEILGGAIAFRRMSDPETGLVADGVIIGRYGVMADEAVY